MIDPKKVARTLLGAGAILMFLFGIVFIIVNLLAEIGLINAFDLQSLNITLANYTLGTEGWGVSGSLTVIASLFGIYGYFSLKNIEEKRDMGFTWGANGIILGLIGGTIGGFIIFIAGVILILDYLRE